MTILTNPRPDGRGPASQATRGAALQTALLLAAVTALLVLVAGLGWNQYRPAEQPDPKIVISIEGPGQADAAGPRTAAR